MKLVVAPQKYPRPAALYRENSYARWTFDFMVDAFKNVTVPDWTNANPAPDPKTLLFSSLSGTSSGLTATRTAGCPAPPAYYSGSSIWRTTQPYKFPYIAITPLHCWASHVLGPLGDEVVWVGADNSTHVRTIVGAFTIQPNGSAIYRLNAPLPASVTPMQLLPVDFYKHTAPGGLGGMGALGFATAGWNTGFHGFISSAHEGTGGRVGPGVVTASVFDRALQASYNPSMDVASFPYAFEAAAGGGVYANSRGRGLVEQWLLVANGGSNGAVVLPHPAGPVVFATHTTPGAGAGPGGVFVANSDNSSVHNGGWYDGLPWRNKRVTAEVIVDLLGGGYQVKRADLSMFSQYPEKWWEGLTGFGPP